VFQVETVLKGSGLLGRTPGVRFGDDTASAIGQGQARLNRDHGAAVGRRPLKIDSLINPDGPTQTATRDLARQVADQWRGFEQRRKPTPPRPLTTPAPPPVSAVAMSDMDARIKQVQDTLTADQTGELTRLADGLSKTRTPGAIAGDISEAINTDGLKAVAEFQVVRDRLAKIGTPDQVKALDESVLGQLSPQIRDQLEGIFNPKPIQPDIKPETDRPITAIPLPSPNRPVHPERERDEIQLRELSAREGEDDAGNGALVDLRERFRSADTDEERHSAAKDVVKALGNPDNARALGDQALLDLESEAQKSRMKPGDYLARRNRINEAFPETRDKNGDIKVAALPLAVPYVIAGGVATVGVVGKYVQDNWENLGLDKVFGPQNRLDAAKPLPPVPGSEPTDIELGQERFPDLSDEDHAPVVPPFDPPSTETPPFPDQGDEFDEPQIQEIEETRPRKPGRSLDDAADGSQAAIKNWKILGPQRQKDARRLVEQYLKGNPSPGSGTKDVRDHSDYKKLRNKNGTRVIIKDYTDGTTDVVGMYLGHTKSDAVEGKTATKLIKEYENRRKNK